MYFWFYGWASPFLKWTQPMTKQKSPPCVSTKNIACMPCWHGMSCSLYLCIFGFVSGPCVGHPSEQGHTDHSEVQSIISRQFTEIHILSHSLSLCIFGVTFWPNIFPNGQTYDKIYLVPNAVPCLGWNAVLLYWNVIFPICLCIFVRKKQKTKQQKTGERDHMPVDWSWCNGKNTYPPSDNHLSKW